MTVALLPFLIYKKQIIRIKKEDWKWFFVYLTFTSATQAPIFYAFNHMDIGSATLLFFASMLLTMYVFGLLFLKEKLTLAKALSFFIACAGLYITFSFSVTVFAVLAAAMAMLNGLASGGEVSSSKKLSGTYSALYLTWLSWLIIVPTNGILSLVLGETQHLPSWDIAWAYQAGYAVAGLLGFWAVIEGLKYLEASIGGLLGLLEIVFSISFGILIFHEALTPRIILGAALIMFAAALPHIVSVLQFNKQNHAATS